MPQSFRVTRIKLNSAGAKALLQSQGVVDDLQARAERVAIAAGGAPDFEVDVEVRAGRAHASVRTATAAGRRAEAEDRTLTRAVDAAR